MKIRNLTKLSTERLRKLIKFACPPGVASVFVTFKYWRDYCAKAYTSNWLAAYNGGKRDYLLRKRGGKTELPDIMIGLKKTPRGPPKCAVFTNHPCSPCGRPIYQRSDTGFELVAACSPECRPKAGESKT